jgi:tripartite motif-containing protein 71
MRKIPYEQWPEQTQRSRDVMPTVTAAIAFLIAAFLVLFVLFPPIEGKSGVPVSRKISTLNYSVVVTEIIGQPIGGAWLLPTSVAAIEDTLYVVDAGDNRIIELDTGGRLVTTFDATVDDRLDLQQPMSIATDGSQLYIADSLGADIVVLNPAGTVDRVLALEARPGDMTPRPIGVAIGKNGDVIVSDAENHRVLILDSEGHTVGSFGTGTREGGSDGLNVPAGLDVDADGNIYVVDTLNGRVVKLTPEGDFIRDFSSLADTAGSLARPKDVAVDGAGRIFVSDGLQAAIEVFSPEGDYLGVIGRRNPDDATAGSIFEMPSGLLLDGDRMYVVDAVRGLVELRLSGASTMVIPDHREQPTGGT